MKEQVLALAGEMAGSGVSAALLEPLCEAAVERWRQRLPDGMNAEDCGTAFVCAAAFTAAADLLVGQSGGSVGDFTVGEISVKGKAAAECQQGCQQAAEVLLGGLPSGIRAEELVWEGLHWEKETEMFLRRGRLRCQAVFVAQSDEDGETFLDFQLKGVLTS